MSQLCNEAVSRDLLYEKSRDARTNMRPDVVLPAGCSPPVARTVLPKGIPACPVRHRDVVLIPSPPKPSPPLPRREVGETVAWAQADSRPPLPIIKVLYEGQQAGALDLLSPLLGNRT